MEDEICITGIAGRYPNCESFDEFTEALLSGTDLVTEDSKRYPPGILGTPKRGGKINNIEYFDAGYFGISPKQANFMDPKHRVMFETAFEAIVDAGYNPKEIRGSKTGVYVGIGQFDNLQAYKEIEKTDGYTIIGSCLAQVANRTSYCFDLKGPSYIVDTACSSGFYALVNAVKDLEMGETESAIVSVVHLTLHPHETKEFNELNMLAKDGKCKVYSTERDGYVRSEAIVTLFIQKKSKCRRLYSTILGARTNCDGFKIEGITYPSSQLQLDLMRHTCQTKNINPLDVSYVEMHGTGTPAGDIEECKSITNFFCEGRKEPLPIGAVKSNMGHAEISSGLCSISKVLVAMETGIIPGNLHCDKLDYTLPGLDNGKLKVVVENLPWDGGLAALNCFGFGGANGHVILESNRKIKPNPTKKSHRLINVSGRTEEAVNHLLDSCEKRQDDDEFLALLDEIHKINVDGHQYRGSAVLGDNPTRQVNYVSQNKRPIWFIYTGMGCQWTAMGKDLLKFDVFRKTFDRCNTALKPYNVDLYKLVLDENPGTLEDIANSFSTITAMEIALTDLIKSLGIEPDNFAGHSLGEVGCAYCDGNLTPEQAILIGFARGYATVQSKCAPGAMAAVGLSEEECSKWLPEGVSVACVNSGNSVTISGTANIVKIFVEKLQEKGVFAKMVKTGGYAFHSKHLHDISPILKNFVEKVITDPKPRSEKWISSSWREEEWNNPLARMNGAYYHYNNFRNPVLFEQVLNKIPKDAVVIEVAPHGLLQSILKKAVGPDATIISLADRASKDNVQFFLNSIGKFYVSGGQPTLRSLYNTVQFPVGKGTPNIGSLIKWDHSTKWYTPFFEANNFFGKKVTVNTSDDQYAHFTGHEIDGRVLMPATGYLELVWKIVATMHIKTINEFPIVFENIKFLRATVLPTDQNVTFLVNIMKQSGYFEIFEGGSVCCSGTVVLPKNIDSQFIISKIDPRSANGYLPMKSQDIYKYFHMKRYLYEGTFKGLKEVDIRGEFGTIKWNKSFSSCMDAMLQLTLIPDTGSDLLLPSRVQRVVINPVQHLQAAESGEIDVLYDQELRIIRAGGIEIVNTESTRAPRKQQDVTPVLETHTFVPYETTSQTSNEVNLEHTLTIALGIIAENQDGNFNLKAAEVTINKDTSLKQQIEGIVKNQPQTNIQFTNASQTGLDFLVFTNGIVDKAVLNSLRKDGFVLYYGDNSEVDKFGLSVAYQNVVKGKGLYLLREHRKPKTYAVVNIRNSDFAWLAKAQQIIKEDKTEILYLFSQDDNLSGIMGLVKCLTVEPTSKVSVKCVFIRDEDAERFTLDSEFYSDQLYKNLTFNAYWKGVWGSYKHLPVHKMKHIEVSHACNLVQTVGDFSTLNWVERPSSYFKYFPSSELAYVFYSALNFKDVMISSGKLASSKSKDPCSTDLSVGLEFSGVLKSGKRVMGIVSDNGLGLQVMSDPLFTWEVPKSWSLEEAATIPVVYATCYYAMIMRGQMQHGESILIHAGTGGIGLAAISIALSMNCNVFTTVGTAEKKEFLKKMFPQLNLKNIGNSRDPSFEQMIKKATKGQGVDLVLNSLASNLFQSSLRCIGRRGRFLEIGKVDIIDGSSINASVFARNSSFHAVFLDDLFLDTSNLKEQVFNLVSEGISKGVVQPLPRTVFAEDQVEDAYRFLSTGKHKGKVLIKIREENQTNLQSPQRTICALPKMYFDSEKTFILIGGLGGFGLELANFLIKRNAKKIVLNSRRRVWNGYQSLCLKRWSEIDGVTVAINNDDSATLKGAEALVKYAEKLGPVGGVFNMALVLQDALFTNQTVEKYEAVFKAKIGSGLNMDQITRKHCQQLEHFVVFSSVASGRGNPGQTNYSMANSALERLCEQRREDGLPGLAIQWGAVGQVGTVADSAKYEKSISSSGIVPQPINSCLDVLETFMLQPCAVGASLVLDNESANLKETSGKTPMEIVAHILGIKNIANINKSQTLAQIGTDSLMTSEIKQTLYRNFNIELGVEEIRDLTFEQLSSLNGDVDTNNDKNEETVAQKQNGHHHKSVNAMLAKEPVLKISNDKFTKTVFFLHPIEGHVEYMVPLAKKLRATVVGLQSTKETDFEDLKSYATYMVKRIKNIQSKGPYDICGYSFGGVLGFEIGIQLEKQGETVSLYFIDGSPSFLKRILDDLYEKGDKCESRAKSNILKAFVNTFDEVDQVEANSLLHESLAWETQLKIVGNLVSKSTNYNTADVEISADRFFKRLTAGYFYVPKEVFKGKTILVRSKDVFVEMANDYDLGKNCSQQIQITKLKGDHKQILMEPYLSTVADLINSALV